MRPPRIARFPVVGEAAKVHAVEQKKFLPWREL
jgi:hypothetical protein